MQESSPSSRGSIAVGTPPTLRLELRRGDGPSTAYEFQQESVVLGTVSGCDLRLPGSDLPPLLCILTRRPDGLHLRKLAPALALLVNGQPRSEGRLADNDRLEIGPYVFGLHFTSRSETTP